MILRKKNPKTRALLGLCYRKIILAAVNEFWKAGLKSRKQIRNHSNKDDECLN